MNPSEAFASYISSSCTFQAFGHRFVYFPDGHTDWALLIPAGGRNSQPCVVVASGDSDCAALLSSNTSWLELRPLPTPACPAACRLVTAESFAAEHGYPPAAHGDYLALAGNSSEQRHDIKLWCCSACF